MSASLMTPLSFREQCVNLGNEYLELYYSAMDSMATAPSASQIDASASSVEVDASDSASQVITKEELRQFALKCMDQYHITTNAINHIDVISGDLSKNVVEDSKKSSLFDDLFILMLCLLGSHFLNYKMCN